MMTAPTIFTHHDPSTAQRLSAKERFAKAVKVPSVAIGAAGALLAIAIVLFVYNVIGTLRSLEPYGGTVSFGEMFFITDTCPGVSFCDYPTFSPLLWAQVWGPLIVGPLALAFLIYALATRGSRIGKAHRGFVEGGFVGNRVPTSMTFAVNRIGYTLDVVTHPGVAEDAAFAWTRDFNQYVQTLDKKQFKALSKTLVSTFAKKPHRLVPTRQIAANGINGMFFFGTQTKDKNGAVLAVSLTAKGELEGYPVALEKLA